jgi:hypothetical protein
MKVLDLQCGVGHSFEGWFGCEEDFVTQSRKSMVQCPMCGDAHITKKLSAPRLNLLNCRDASLHQDISDPKVDNASPPVTSAVFPGPDLTAAWMQIAQSIVSNTDDVGTEFAEVARKMHYGETEGRAIRGQTTRDEARSLIEEGIEIVPFALPDALKKPLQ